MSYLYVNSIRGENVFDLNTIYNIDCMQLMQAYPDKYFDLAICDPPYGINKAFKATSHIARYGGVDYANDLKPSPEYFKELFRVSKNQIIWGYNHLSDMLPALQALLPATMRGLILWVQRSTPIFTTRLCADYRALWLKCALLIVSKIIIAYFNSLHGKR